MKRFCYGVDYKYIRFGQKYTPSNFESLNNLKNSSFFEIDLDISEKLLIFVADLLIINSKIMHNINLIRYTLLNPIGDSTVYKIQKIKEHYLEVIQDGEFLYRFNDKEEACGHLTDLIIAKSANDVPRLNNNDRELIKLVLENKALFNENVNVLGDIKEKAKSFKYTVFEFETIEDYKAALEDFVMNDGTVIVDNDLTDNSAESAMSANEKEISDMLDDEFDGLCEMEMLGRHNPSMDSGAASAMSDDETPDLDKISEMLDDEFDTLCDTERREMLNGKELPTKAKYAIVERTLGIGATDWDFFKLKRSCVTYSDLGTAIDLMPSDYSNGWFSKEFMVVNLADPNWKQSLIESDNEEYFIMKREVIRSGTDANDWEIDSDIFETWSEANANMPKDYDNFQFIIASRPKEKEEKKVDTRRRVFNFGD